MKVGIPYWQGHISPVLDACCGLLLVDIEGGQEQQRLRARLEHEDTLARAKEIMALQPDVILCCAVSRALEACLRNAGVRVVQHCYGEVEVMLKQFMAGLPRGEAGKPEQEAAAVKGRQRGKRRGRTPGARRPASEAMQYPRQRGEGTDQSRG